jgi:hypothetical protein
MEKDLLPLQDQVGGMEVVVVDRWVALKKIWSLQGHVQVVQLSAIHI